MLLTLTLLRAPRATERSHSVRDPLGYLSVLLYERIFLYQVENGREVDTGNCGVLGVGRAVSSLTL